MKRSAATSPLPHVSPSDPDLVLYLDRALSAGQRELIIPGFFALSGAAGLCLELPPVTGEDRDAPTGWAIFPPRDFGPSVVCRPGQRDASGAPVPDGRHGVVCCMWITARRPDRVVHRLSFPGDNVYPALFPVDVYDDQIASECVLKVNGVPLPSVHPGWAICRLEPSPEARIAMAAKAAIDARLKQG